jgi:hypothetical protein
VARARSGGARNTGHVDLVNPESHIVRRQLEAVRAERVGLDHLRARFDEALVDFPNEVARSQIERVEARVRLGAARYETRTGPAVPEQRPGGDECGEFLLVQGCSRIGGNFTLRWTREHVRAFPR